MNLMPPASVLFDDLPYDMRVWLAQILEADGHSFRSLPLNQTPLPLIRVDTALMHTQCAHWEWDERGQAHVDFMKSTLDAGETLPPIVVSEGRIIDGRHRVHAEIARRTLCMIAIDYDAWVGALLQPALSRGPIVSDDAPVPG